MYKSEYLKRARNAYDSGKIDAETYDAMIENVDIFCDEDDSDSYGLPRTYAEIEYDDFDNPEAIEGARFDDRNYLRYMER
jgi:hypothetical protein